MIIYDIPLDPPIGYWTVLDVKFETRREALRYASTLVRQHARQGGVALLNIEGTDGQWRLFTHDLKAVQLPLF